MIIILGASGGIGTQVLKFLLTNTDQKIIAIYKSNKLSISHKRITPINLDISNIKKINTFFIKNKKSLNKVILINLLVLNINNLFVNYKDYEIKKLLDTNIYGPIIFMNKILKIMLFDNYGKIIMFSSRPAIQGIRGASIYSLIKGSMKPFVKSFNKEYNKLNVCAYLINLEYFNFGLIKQARKSVNINFTDVKKLNMLVFKLSKNNYQYQKKIYNL